MTSKKRIITLHNISAEKEKEKQESKLMLAALTLQKQLQILKLREYLFIGGFIGGAALLRAWMQFAPSVEPITFFAILSGWMFGKRKGMITGASALFLSNFFVIGGQGPWTLFQAAGFGAAGFFGGFLRKKANLLEVMLVTVISTLVFEILVNVGTIAFIPISIFTAFLFALPFALIHLASNAIFSLLLPKAKEFAEKKGGFNESEIYSHLAGRFGSNPRFSWLFRKKKSG